jgi:site-specific recombinase XerD
VEPISALSQSWHLSLLAENKAPQTIRTYLRSVRALDEYLAGDEPTKARLEAFFLHRLRIGKPATAALHFRSLQQFFKWAVAEGEIDVSPMSRLRAPAVPEEPPAVLSDSDIRHMLAACDGPSFTDRRDTAIIRLLLDTGLRRSELAGLRLADVDLVDGSAVVLGKGRRPRTIPFGRKTAQAIDRYMRIRTRHPLASRQELWLGRNGVMTDSGIYQVVRHRGRQAGVERVFAHRFRHTFAHLWQVNGGSESDLMRLVGWRSPQMLRRYGASAADLRARSSYRRLALGDEY